MSGLKVLAAVSVVGLLVSAGLGVVVMNPEIAQEHLNNSWEPEDEPVDTRTVRYSNDDRVVLLSNWESNVGVERVVVLPETFRKIKRMHAPRNQTHCLYGRVDGNEQVTISGVRSASDGSSGMPCPILGSKRWLGYMHDYTMPYDKPGTPDLERDVRDGAPITAVYDAGDQYAAFYNVRGTGSGDINVRKFNRVFVCNRGKYL